MSLSVLKIEIDELKNSILHLERSNRELKDLLQTDPDPEYRLAIGDNITTIAKKRARVAALEEELRRFTGEEYESDGVAVPVSENAADATGQGQASAVTASAATDMQVEQGQRPVARADEPTTAMDLDAAPGSGAADASGKAEDAGSGAGAGGASGESSGLGMAGGAPAALAHVDDAAGGDGVWL